MATNFPGSQDSFTNPTSSDTLDSPDHAGQHTNVNDAVEAIELALLDGAPLHIDDANERVGIGTTTPAEELDVVGDVQVSGRLGVGGGISAELDIKGASNPEIRLQSTDSSDPFIYFGDQVDAVRGGIGYDTSADALLLRGYNNSTRIAIDSAGLVGIGTTAPSKKLTVAGDIQINGSSPEIYFTDTDTNADSKISASSTVGSLIIGADINNEVASTNMVFQTDGNTKMIIKDSGNVGIGDDTPSYKLDVNGTGRFTGTLTLDGDLTGTSNSNFFVGNDSNERILFQESSNRIFFMTNGSYRWYIDSGGDLRPYADKAYDIGSSSLRVHYLYGSVINIDNEIQVSNGTAADPSFTFSSDGDTGIYRSNTNEIGITTGNSTAATFGSSAIDFNRTTYLDGRAIFRYTSSSSNDWSLQPVRIETTYDSGFAARWGSSDSNTGQLRPAAGIWYVRNHNDSAYWTLAAVISNQSSRDEKQDIAPWTPPTPVSAGSMVNPEYQTTMSLLNDVEVVSYRWDKQRYCTANETFPDDPDHDDGHVCGVDCDQSPEDPCNYYLNWERGTIGFVAEDLGEVIPQVTNIDRHTGANTAVDGLAMSAVIVKALQEIDARLSALETA